MSKTTWTNGLKVDSTLAENLKGSVTRIRNKKASLIVIDGGVGEGKTTLSVICAKLIAEELGQDFSIKDQVRMGGKDFLKGMDWCLKNKKNVIIYDEAGDFNTRASLTYFNQNMNRVFETYRALSIIVILCLPSFADIDTSLMKKNISRYLIHCYSRNNNYGNYKAYALWRMWYLKQKFAKYTVPADAYNSTTPNFYGRFKDLDPEDANTLQNLSIKGKKEIIQKGLMASEGLVTIGDVALKTGYSVQSIRNYINFHKIKGTKSGSNKLFFHKEIIENIIREKETKGSLTTR